MFSESTVIHVARSVCLQCVRWAQQYPQGPILPVGVSDAGPLDTSRVTLLPIVSRLSAGGVLGRWAAQGTDALKRSTVWHHVNRRRGEVTTYR